MSTRVVNLALLVVTIVVLASGVLLFSTTRAEDAWLYTFHRYAGLLLLVLLIPKTRIIARSLSRRWKRQTRFDVTTWAAVSLTGLVILTVALAFAWTFDWLPFYLDLLIYVTPIGLHWYLGFALVPFFAWHAWKRWIPLAGRPSASSSVLAARGISRRKALNLLGAGAIGLVGLGALDMFAASAGWARRFTGSRILDSFQGNRFPVTNSDARPEIDIAAWRLRVGGRVAEPLELTYADLLESANSSFSATLDCTLGWASTQTWSGASVKTLLELAGVADDARQLTCRSVTGALAVLSMDEAREALIATHIDGEKLGDEHGFPARLVAPARRGYHWIKWMNELVVS